MTLSTRIWTFGFKVFNDKLYTWVLAIPFLWRFFLSFLADFQGCQANRNLTPVQSTCLRAAQFRDDVPTSETSFLSSRTHWRCPASARECPCSRVSDQGGSKPLLS